MRVSKNWLKDYLNLDNITDEELFKKINAHVCEIETYKKMVTVSNLTVGYVHECVMHPDSDHLHVCQVEISEGQMAQIVCGAPNVKAGVKVIVANVGADFGDFKIKKSKIRGVESNGMLCSLQELGIEAKFVEDEFKDGIYLLADDAVIGSDPLEYLGLDDIVIDLECTSNRSDLLSIEGVAYDIGASLGQEVLPIMPSFEVSDKKNPVTVEVLTDKCYKYNARYIANVTIKPSPNWLKARLIASNIRPINNVVDITNFVLMEMGQPLHSFDADKLGNKIVVRNAYENEEIITLDDIKRTLSSSDVVITNGSDALCVAGVMGGASTEVTNETKNIVLEAAYFDPLSIRKTSTKLGLKSESSIRFERKIDYDRVERALDYACQLLVELADAEVYEGIACDVKKVIEPKYIDITVEKINGVLGTSLPKEEVEDIFNRLAYEYTLNDNVYHILIPSRRMDLEQSVQDIIEDVARMNGYDNIPTTIAKTRDKGALTFAQKTVRSIRLKLAHMGLNDIVSYSLINERDLNLYTLEQKDPVKVLMPMTEDKAVMRQSVLNGVIDAVKYNKARKFDDLALFEIGKTYSTVGEELKLGIAITGLFNSCLWNGTKMPSTFYVLKGVVDNLAAMLNTSFTYKPCSSVKSFHPGRCAYVCLNDTVIGIIGELHPKFAKENDLSTTIACEISIDKIIGNSNGFKYEPINKYPSITRDLAIVCKKDIEAQAVLNIVKQTAKKHLTALKVFDVYMGENVASDEKSIAFSMVLSDSTKTMETVDADKIVKSILTRLERELNARLR